MAIACAAIAGSTLDVVAASWTMNAEEDGSVLHHLLTERAQLISGG